MRAGTEALVRDALARLGAPGVALAWVRRDGSTGHLVHGVGSVIDGAPVTPTTRFHLFSGTKLYTAAVVMRLVERGAVTLETPVRSVLPELPLRPELTVAHLLSHASGLPDSLRAFLATHLHGEPAPTADAALARYGLAKGRAPGGKARYGNVNYAVLGALVARLGGAPFEEVMRRELLEPLGATLTLDDDGTGSAAGHVGRFSPMWLVVRLLFPETTRKLRAGTARGLVSLRPFSLDTAAIGGLVGSAPAFLPFLREMLDPGDGVLRAESKHAMLTVRTPGAAGIVSREGVGLGWKCGRVGARLFFNHEGGGAGFGTETRLYPDEGLGIVLLANVSHSAGLSRSAHQICEQLREALVGS